MSGKITGMVWDLDLPHGELFVLLALADHADHWGDNVRPSLDRLAWKTGYGKRQIQRLLKALEARGLLLAIRKGGGRRRPNEYSIVLDDAPRKPDFEAPQAKNGDKMSTNTANHDKMSTKARKGPYHKAIHANDDIMSTNSANAPQNSRFAENVDTRMSPLKDHINGDIQAENVDTRMSTKTSLDPSRKTKDNPPPISPPQGEARAKGKTSLPTDFALTDRMRAWGSRTFPAVELDRTTEQWLDACRAKDYRYKDWEAAWKNGMRFAVEKGLAVLKPFTWDVADDES